ncbi:MAG: hypothetical protein ACXVB9_14955 [Bdellovibrionota bacterium]
MKYFLPILASLALTACGQKNDSASTASQAASTTTAANPSTDPNADFLVQVSNAESQVEAAGCIVQVRDSVSSRGPRGDVRVDCDRVPNRFEYLRESRNALLNYGVSVRAALGASLDASDRNLLEEKYGALNRALIEVSQRIQALNRRPDRPDRG